MQPTHGDFDFADVEGIDTLRRELKRMHADDTDAVKVLSDLFMNGHEGSTGYLTFGNNKISKNTAIFNLNSATDCPNARTKEDGESETGKCQVSWTECYAHKAEDGLSPDALDKRRRQQYLWDNIDAVTFAKALEHCFERKKRDIVAVRFSESGDFRHDGDIIKVNRVAKMIDQSTYTYSSSHKLDWSEATDFVVNQSNNLADYGERLFSAVPTQEDVPEGGVVCPFEKARAEGMATDERPKCGECMLCFRENGPDVYVLLH